jgi:uncharacterized paraquat-inducible protein A
MRADSVLEAALAGHRDSMAIACATGADHAVVLAILEELRAAGVVRLHPARTAEITTRLSFVAARSAGAAAVGVTLTVDRTAPRLELSRREYKAALEDGAGVCTGCSAITLEDVAAEATCLECPRCRTNTVDAIGVASGIAVVG